MAQNLPQNLPQHLLEELRREWEKLTLADDFVFSRVMQDVEVCKELLELLLGIKITRIQFPTAQRVFQSLKLAKGVRLDVYVQEAGGQRVFDIEMQTVVTREEALRARYYQGMLDLDNLLRGSDYIQLPQTYIIFLCMGDPFGLELPVYSTHSYIDPDNRHPYDDKTRKIFYNVGRCRDVEEPGVRRLLEYLQSKRPTDNFTRRLDQMVEELKTIEMGFSDYIAIRQREFDWLRQGKEEGFEQGISIGREEGAHQNKLETARAMLGIGLSVEQVQLCTNLPLETVQELAEEG